LLVLLGGVMGGLYTLSLALIGERFRGADLTQANTAFVMTFQLGTIVGPPYAGAIMQVAGVSSFPLALAPPLLLLTVAMVTGARVATLPDAHAASWRAAGVSHRPSLTLAGIAPRWPCRANISPKAFAT